MIVWSIIYSAAVPSPNLPTLKELSNALDTVVDWHTLGIKLGVKGYQLRQIEKDYRDSSRCKIEMLDCCVRSGNPPTWKKVANALCKMGEHQSAFKIRRKHLKGTPSSATRQPCHLSEIT